MTNQEKLEKLKEWLKDNNIPFIENHKSCFGVTMDLKIPSLMIAVFLSGGDREWETSVCYSNSGNFRLLWVYKPFFIRESETAEFIIEKMQNCIIDRMQLMQRRWLNEQKKKKR